MERSLGVCYYPEHWPKSKWKTDAAKMKRMGFKWVRVAEFSWAKLEPKAFSYDFEWLDLAIEILGNEGLSIVLGIPTAAPPRWMIDLYPNMLQEDINGVTRGFGSRRHYCFCDPAFLEHCQLLVKSWLGYF